MQANQFLCLGLYCTREESALAACASGPEDGRCGEELSSAAHLRTASHGRRCRIRVAPPAPRDAPHPGPAGPRPCPHVHCPRRGFAPAPAFVSRGCGRRQPPGRSRSQRRPKSSSIAAGSARPAPGPASRRNRTSVCRSRTCARGRCPAPSWPSSPSRCAPCCRHTDTACRPRRPPQLNSAHGSPPAYLVLPPDLAHSDTGKCRPGVIQCLTIL